MNDDNKDEEDDPKLSSAALCISINYLGMSFRPEFTHQCFEGEWIRGYRPFHETIDEEFRKRNHHHHQNHQATTTVVMTTKNNHNGKQNKSQAIVTNSPSKTKNSNNGTLLEQPQQQQQQVLHKSHLNHNKHNGATRELKICVELAPSGQSCAVHLHFRNKHPDNHSNQKNNKRSWRGRRGSPSRGVTKRRRFDSHPSMTEDDDEDDEEEEEYEEESEEEEEDEEPQASGSSDNDEEHTLADAPGPTRRRRMPVKDIVERIQKALPTIVTTTNHSHGDQNEKPKHNNNTANATTVHDNYLSKPIGTVLEEYKHRSHDFVICFAEGKDVIEFHHNVQRLALFYIENASDVDLESEDGENWRILYLLRKHRPNHNSKSKGKRFKYSLVGYLTLFYFSAPFRKPKPGIVARICQVLILPPYQRAGHGKRLLHCVHDLAHGQYDDKIYPDDDSSSSNDSIVEINVEDPAPGFVALRNMVDYERLVQSKKDGHPWLPQLNRDPTRVSRTTFATLTDAQVQQAAQVAKITPLQVHICFEIYQLQALREIIRDSMAAATTAQHANNHHHYHHQNTTSSNIDGSCSSHKEELETSYRLMVKKRLSKTHRDEFVGGGGGCGARGWGKKEMQNRLSELFDELFRQYHAILGIPMES